MRFVVLTELADWYRTSLDATQLDYLYELLCFQADEDPFTHKDLLALPVVRLVMARTTVAKLLFDVIACKDVSLQRRGSFFLTNKFNVNSR